MRKQPFRTGVAMAGSAVLTAGLLGPAANAQETADGPQATGSPAELLISEYVEGSSYNKAVELYNGTGQAVDLAGYRLEVYFNGNTTPNGNFELTGTVAPGDTFVFADEDLAEYADQTTNGSLWNGDDAIVLRDGDAVIDSLGQVGVDPGDQWGSGDTSTQNNTLRRQASVCAGDTDPADAFDPAAEFDGYPEDTFDGLGSHTVTCDGGDDPGPGDAPVLNEFSASTDGTDVEYLEVYGAANTDYSGLTVLQVEGDGSSPNLGTVSSAHDVGSTDGDGFWLGDLSSNTLQNGTLTLLLVDGYTGETVLDEDQDGAVDAPAWDVLVDAVAVTDGDAGDLTYGEPVLAPGYDGLSEAPGGASRIPDGTDTDSASDWVRNDFDLAGIDGHEGTLVEGEAVNTPGAPNTTESDEEPPPGAGACGDPSTMIGDVQGDGDTSPVEGQAVQVEGTVVGDFQQGGFDGYYVQDSGDGDPATSDGVFVYAEGGAEVDTGEQVRVSGTVSEYFEMTQVTATDVAICADGGSGDLPEPVQVELPMDRDDLERYEGMRVTLPQDLAILEYYNYGRFGEIVVGTDRQFQPTAVHEPYSDEAEALAEQNANSRITIDDGRSVQNPDPAIHPDGDDFTLDNTFRGGDLVTNATGVLDYRFDLWRLQPTEGADFTEANQRPEVPEVGGSMTVASFNVLNYFTTLGSRGADTPEELQRQEDKIVAALAEMDADVVGLVEIENNDDEATSTLVDALNDEVGAGTYDYVETGTIGTDAITTALIYKPANVAPEGDFAILDSSVDERFLDEKNRPVLAQTFEEKATGESVTVAVNHLKSKGSSCEDVGDPDDEVQGNCNGVRTDAAEAMVDWLATDPTGTGSDNVLITGDLNAYDKEDPIDALTDGGYTDLVAQFGGEYAYSYVFDGQLGYLDHALANPTLQEKVTGAAIWHSNADEPSLLDYDMTFKQDPQDALYEPNAYRASDHDAVLVGLDLAPADTVAPELEVGVDPETIWPPNHKLRTVTTTVEATDDSGTANVTLVGVTHNGNDRDVEVVSDTEFELRATKGREYTITYEAEDDAGNTTTESVTVVVPHDQGRGQGLRR